MTKIFFTSDTHFGHQRTFDYSMRSMYFKDVQEMNDEMVHRWNDIVGVNDTVYHLGDFGDYEYAKKLNGKIELLFGNYERDPLFGPTKEQKSYFENASELSSWIMVNNRGIIKSERYLMVHEPENKGRSKFFYLFGHIHEKQKIKKNGLNVGVDVHNFTPISEETVEFYRNAIENIYDDNCFLNY